MKKYFTFLFVFGLILWSCEKDTTELNTDDQGLGTTQPVWDGFYLDLHVYDTLGNPMDSVVIEAVDLQENGAHCGNEDFMTDSTGHCMVCVMYGHAYDAPPAEPDSQKFSLSYESYVNEIELEVLIYDTIAYNHNYQF